MADVATLTALFNLIVAKIRDKGNGLPTSPKELRETLEPIVAALTASDTVKEDINDLIAAMLPDNMIKAIDPYELRVVLYAIVAALNNGSNTSSIPIRRPYVIKDQNGNLPDILPNVPYLAYVRDFGTTINDIIAEVSPAYTVGIINYVGTIINNESDNYDEPQGQGILWFELYLRTEPPIVETLEFLSTEFLSTEFL